MPGSHRNLVPFFMTGILKCQPCIRETGDLLITLYPDEHSRVHVGAIKLAW
jgi:hypothetical protein